MAEDARYAWCTVHKRFWDRKQLCPCREFPLNSCLYRIATEGQVQAANREFAPAFNARSRVAGSD